MEEKLSALEALGVFKGLFTRKWWNEHSSSTQTKHYSSDTHTSTSFRIKDRNVIKLQKKNADIIQNSEAWIEKKKNFIIKGEEMANEKSESDIPTCDKSLMNTQCDNDNEEKTEENLKPAPKLRNLKKENSFEATSEESSGCEEVRAPQKKISVTVQEWVNHLPSSDDTILKDEENQVVSANDDSNLVRAQLSREASLQSNSSLDSLLESRRPDPVEIFLNLGFGGLPGVDTENCRIPKRFLVPSKCKGGDWHEFLRRELIQAQNFECSSLGFRGLSGPSYRRPSAIVANIMEKLRERTVPPSHKRSRFSAVAKMVLNEKSVLNKLTPEFQSVLSPDSRKFLQNQGKKSPEVPRRRIIFGQKSFAFAHDGELIEVESSSVEEKTPNDSSTGLGNSKETEEERPSFPNAEVLLKLRRSSLQKQKKVDEDADLDDVFYVMNNEEHSKEPVSLPSSECTKKAGKIPRRFLSSTNLKALEESSLSEAMRLEVEKEIMSLSQKIKSISNQDLPSVLQQVKELRSKIENNGQESSETDLSLLPT